MDIPDAVWGKIVLVTTTTTFVIIVLWVNVYPLIDEDSEVYALTPDPQWLLLFCALWGLGFVGGLMGFTLYHIYPYL